MGTSCARSLPDRAGARVLTPHEYARDRKRQVGVAWAPGLSAGGAGGDLEPGTLPAKAGPRTLSLKVPQFALSVQDSAPRLGTVSPQNRKVKPKTCWVLAVCAPTESRKGEIKRAHSRHETLGKSRIVRGKIIR